MPKTLEGKLIAKGKKFGMVVSRFNEFISSKLLAGAIDALARHGVKEDEMTVAWVPGSWEIPYTASRMAKSGKYDAVICLGAVIRGSTPHFDYISAEVAKGIATTGMSTGVPTMF